MTDMTLLVVAISLFAGMNWWRASAETMAVAFFAWKPPQSRLDKAQVEWIISFTLRN